MMEAIEKIITNMSMYNLFKEAMVTLPNIKEKVSSRSHMQIVIKRLNLRAENIFRRFHDKLIGK